MTESLQEQLRRVKGEISRWQSLKAQAQVRPRDADERIAELEAEELRINELIRSEREEA